MPKERPPHATEHCRHYSYNGEPVCAVNVSIQNALATCCTDKGDCPKREDYTIAERHAWNTYVGEKMTRNMKAVASLPNSIAERSTVEVECPNCGGTLRCVRWSGGANLDCLTTRYCVGPMYLNIGRGGYMAFTELNIKELRPKLLDMGYVFQAQRRMSYSNDSVRIYTKPDKSTFVAYLETLTALHGKYYEPEEWDAAWRLYDSLNIHYIRKLQMKGEAHAN